MYGAAVVAQHLPVDGGVPDPSVVPVRVVGRALTDLAAPLALYEGLVPMDESTYLHVGIDHDV